MNTKIPPTSYYQRLFDHMAQEHKLTLLDSEMNEIVHIVRELSFAPTEELAKRVESVAGQLRSAVQLSRQCGVPCADHQLLLDWANELERGRALSFNPDAATPPTQTVRPTCSKVAVDEWAGELIHINEADRQAIILALADLASRRPGWLQYLGDISEAFKGRAMFNELHAMRKGRVHPDIPEFRGKKPLVMYFETDKEMDEVIAAFKELYPRAVGRKLE